MKQLLACFAAFLLIAVFYLTTTPIASHVWAGGPPTVERIERNPEGTVNFVGGTPQIINRGTILYNGQLHNTTQIGNTLYLPDAQLGYTIPQGYEPITIFNQTILYNPSTRSAVDVNWNDAIVAPMPITDTTAINPPDHIFDPTAINPPDH